MGGLRREEARVRRGHRGGAGRQPGARVARAQTEIRRQAGPAAARGDAGRARPAPRVQGEWSVRSVAVSSGQ